MSPSPPRLAGAAGVGAVAVGADAKRVGIFERFDGRVEGVGHVAVDAVDAVDSLPVSSGARAHAAGDGFVVGEGRVGARIEAADGQIAHRAVAGGGDAMRARPWRARGAARR